MLKPCLQNTELSYNFIDLYVKEKLILVSLCLCDQKTQRHKATKSPSFSLFAVLFSSFFYKIVIILSGILQNCKRYSIFGASFLEIIVNNSKMINILILLWHNFCFNRYRNFSGRFLNNMAGECRYFTEWQHI